MKIGRFQALQLDHVQERLARVDVPASGYLVSWRRWCIVFATLEQRITE